MIFLEALAIPLTLVIHTNKWYIPQHVLYCILVIRYNLSFVCFKTCSPVIIGGTNRYSR